MQTIEVSRRLAIWTIVGVCVLSAAIGSSIALLAETGPRGKQGARGAAGPRGQQGPEGTVEPPDYEYVEAEIEDLVRKLGDVGALEGRLDQVERTSATPNPRSKGSAWNWKCSVEAAGRTERRR